MSSKYLIADEPRPSTLGKHVVNPQWPMFAQMFAGTWLALPWFVFNSLALGSPNFKKDFAFACLSLVSNALLLLLRWHYMDLHILAGIWIPLTFLSIIAVKIITAYMIFFSQMRVFELWKHFGGVEKNGAVFLILATVIGHAYISSAVTNQFLHILLF